MLTEPSIEDLFERFRAAADHAALAAVFDRVAPRLLLVAAHVTPDPAAAEDLVQETFLQAMQRAEQWQSGRPLLPWLSTIMRHRAVDLARRLRHRRPTAPAELVETATALGADPSEAAATDELLERVEQALAALTSPFREALVLRIVHGLEPTEIAHALGRPPATVRGQLKRGLERMRQLLPAGLAGALATLLLPGAGIAAVRAAVLREAGRDSASTSGSAGDAVPPTPSATGNLAKTGSSTRHAFLALGGLAAAALVLAVSTGFGQSIAPPANAAGATEVAASSANVDGPNDTRTNPTPETRVAADQGEPRPAAEAASTIRGRIVSAFDGAPITGGLVTLSFGRGRFVTSDPTFRSYPEPIVFNAAPDGSFAATWTPSPKMRVYLEAIAPGHTPVDTEWTSVRNGIDIDIGDVPLLRGAELRARVVDERGMPVAGVEIYASRTSGGVELPDSMFSTWIAYERTSGSDGRLAAEMLPIPGTYEFSVVRGSSPWQVVAGSALTLDAGLTGEHEIVVAPATATGTPSVRGRVVDISGNPVPAGLALQLHADMPSLGKGVTGPDGRFELVPEYANGDEKLVLARTERRYRLADPEREYPLDDENVIVRVERRPTFDVAVEVVDARTGKPVERFGLRYLHDYWADEDSFAIPPERFYWPADPETHTAGRTVLEQLPVGRYRLSVHPESGDLATAYMIAFEVEETGSEPVRVELAPHAPLEVILRDSRGEPVAGKKVRLVHLMASKSWSSLFSVEELRMGIGAGRKMAVGLQEVRTDDEGRCVLRAPVDEPRLVLVLGGGGAMGERRELGVVPAEGRTVELELPATAVVRGTIGPPELLAGIGPSAADLAMHAIVRPEDSDLGLSCPQLRLVGPNGERGGRTRLNADGTFAFDEALLGDWSLVIDLEWRIGSGSYTSENVTIAAVAGLQAGETRELDVDASQLLPATLSGRVFVDGAAWTRGRFGVLTADPGDRDRFHIALTPNATFEAVVRPDRYLPFVSWDGEGDRTRYLFAAERLTLGSGQRVEQSFVFEHRVVHVDVRWPDGTTASGERLDLHPVDYPEVRTLLHPANQTDENGRITLDPAPPGRLEVRTKDGDVLGVFTPAAGSSASSGPATIELTLPR